ncbi:MAG: hypothetical protein Q9168_004152 [Polycauliona sp. 1 TL-2023]
MESQKSAAHHKNLPPVKVLWVNPINQSIFDEPIAGLIKSIKQPNVEVDVVSLKLDAPIKLDNLEWRNNYDAYAIGCFYDTALEEAREMSGDAVVRAPCEAALKAIDPLCNKFSVIIGVEKWKVQMRDRFDFYGLARKLASFHVLGLHVDEFQMDEGKARGRMREEAKRAIDEDGAEAIILGCTIEFGFAEQLQEELGVPVVDVVFACFKAAESSAINKKLLGWKPSRKGSMEMPGNGRLDRTGFPQLPLPIGNVINIAKE